MAQLNLLNYGAVGDGITNDTAAVQAALDDLKAEGGTLYCPAPEVEYSVDPLFYMINASAPYGKILGDGRGSSFKLRPQNLALYTHMAVLQIGGTSTSKLKSFIIEDVQFNGNKDAHTNQGSVTANMEALAVDYAVNFEIRNVHVVSALREGIDLDNCEGGLVTGCEAIGNWGTGIHVSENSIGNRIIGNYASGNGYGIRPDGVPLARNGIDQWTTASYNTFVGNVCVSNYRNYKIEGSNAKFGANISNGTPTVADVLTGVA